MYTCVRLHQHREPARAAADLHEERRFGAGQPRVAVHEAGDVSRPLDVAAEAHPVVRARGVDGDLDFGQPLQGLRCVPEGQPVAPEPLSPPLSPLFV